jgi:serine/arginine repetitive matrix protein 2
MYNGIGLRTARGTGTNGYVQRNLSFLKPKTNKTDYSYKEQRPSTVVRKPRDEIMLHKSRRGIEVECLEYREKLEARNE